jgi:parallel beta-helix repeat protein
MKCLNTCGGPAGKWVPFVNCWDSLDDAVYGAIPPMNPIAPEPSRVIAVFGPTQEIFSNNPNFINAAIQGGNVVIDRGPFAPPPPPSPFFIPVYPLRIEECHNAKIGGAGLNPLFPVIEVRNIGGDNIGPLPVGPVLINSVDVVGGAEGVRVGTAIFPTTLKAIRAKNNFAVAPFTGEGFVVTGNNNIINGCSAESNDSGFRVTGNNNTLTNANRALNNIFDGFRIVGNGNLVRGSLATSNGRDGFHVTGAGNTLQDNRANKNIDDGFEISGFGAVGNRLRSNASNQGNDGGANENFGWEYELPPAPGVVIDLGGNKADNIGVPRPTKCPFFPVGNCG